MTTAELKEYLGMVVQTEKEVNLQEQLCQQIKQKMQEHNSSIMRLNKSMAEKGEPIRPALRKNSNDKFSGCGSMIFYLICCIVAYVGGAKKIALFFGLLTAALVLLSVSSNISDEKEIKKSNEESLNKYISDCEMVQKEKNQCQKEIEKLKVQNHVAENYLQQVQKALASSHENLEQMYAYNVVFPKYRNYVMISSIYEYICAGRCTTLEGHEGAYNILELEIRLDRIITQLDAVLRNLSAIRANQYTLYSCLQEANQKIDTLLQEESRMADSMQALGAQSYEMNRRLGELQHSSELANYLAECSQRELHYMNRMNYLAGHYDNPYGNYTPV